MCNTAHKVDDYNGCTYGRDKREQFAKLVQSVRDSRCPAIDSVIGDAEEDTCVPGESCSGKDGSIDKDIGACVPINEQDNPACDYSYSDMSAQGETVTKVENSVKHGARPLLLLSLLVATVMAA